MRLRWEEHINLFVKERQQGFLKGRSLIKDLLEVESAMILRSVDDPDAAAVFLDFASAFPSISQEYIMESLARAGIPTEMINAFGALYYENKCNVSVKGGVFGGFSMHSGVRQGCPLSPLVYALVAEDLLDMIDDLIPGWFARAYADDTALVLQDFWVAAPALVKIFTDWRAVSGLRLNMAKSIIIPLNSRKVDTFAERLRCDAAGWEDMSVNTTCKYLGFYVGPGKSDLSWKKPMDKFKERVSMWKDQPLGLFWDARVFNTFAIPILSFVAQLEDPPEWVMQGIETSLRKVAKGPGGWASPKDLWAFKEAFGMQASFQNLEWIALAAKIRVICSDPACQPHRRFWADFNRLKMTIG